MPSRNTKFARNRGYSDVKLMSKDGPKGDLKNFGVRLGRTVDSEAEKSSRGRKPMNPRGSREHWKDTEYERKIRQEFFCPQLSQKD